MDNIHLISKIRELLDCFYYFKGRIQKLMRQNRFCLKVCILIIFSHLNEENKI